MDDELIRMRAAEQAAAEAAHQLLVAQDVAELRVAVADAAANPIPADVPEGVEQFRDAKSIEIKSFIALFRLFCTVFRL